MTVPASISMEMLNEAMRELAVAIWREHRVGLPDTMNWGSTHRVEGLLVVRNTGDFPTDKWGVHVPHSS